MKRKQWSFGFHLVLILLVCGSLCLGLYFVSEIVYNEHRERFEEAVETFAVTTSLTPAESGYSDGEFWYSAESYEVTFENEHVSFSKKDKATYDKFKNLNGKEVTLQIRTRIGQHFYKDRLQAESVLEIEILNQISQ